MSGPVVCGVGGPQDAAAAAVAGGLAERYGRSLLCVHVLDGARSHEQAARTLRGAVGAAAELAIEHGHPADRLVELAAEREAAFLVVGNGGPRSSLLGSVSADVARRAPCPVIAVPPTASLTGALGPALEPGVEGGIARLGCAGGLQPRLNGGRT